MKTNHSGSLLRPALLGDLLIAAVHSPAFAGDKDKSKANKAAPAPTSGASLLGGALPGGAVVSAREAPAVPAPANQTQTPSSGEKVQSGLAQTGGAMSQGTGARNINSVSNNSMPNRISTNVTVGKQTQTQSFGEKVNSGPAKTQAADVDSPTPPSSPSSAPSPSR
jgi:hypothetical protein